MVKSAVVLTQITFEVAVIFGAAGGLTTLTVDDIELAAHEVDPSVTLKLNIPEDVVVKVLAVAPVIILLLLYH